MQKNIIILLYIDQIIIIAEKVYMNFHRLKKKLTPLLCISELIFRCLACVQANSWMSWKVLKKLIRHVYIISSDSDMQKWFID